MKLYSRALCAQPGGHPAPCLCRRSEQERRESAAEQRLMDGLEETGVLARLGVRRVEWARRLVAAALAGQAEGSGHE